MTNVAATTNVPASYRCDSIGPVSGASNGILQGEMLRGGNPTGAIAAFPTRVVAAQDTFMWDEPEPLPVSACHWLGAALIDQQRFAEAEAVYRNRSRKASAQWLGAVWSSAGRWDSTRRRPLSRNSFRPHGFAYVRLTATRF